MKCELASRFIDYLFTRPVISGSSDPAAQPCSGFLDWELLEEAVAASTSLEQAVGRSIVVADLMSRGRYLPQHQKLASSPSNHSTARSHWRQMPSPTILATRRGVASSALALTAIVVALVVAFSGTPTNPSPGAPGTASTIHQSLGIVGNSQLLSNAVPASFADAPVTTTTVSLPAATVPPAPAPPSLADAPPLRPHEVFGFAPYWTLAQSAGFDVNHISTFAYFSVGVNADGSLDESGAGWIGYQSQALASLVTRAHAAGDRVVLTVNDFDQVSLNQLTSSPTAPATLATALIGAIQAKNLDGVNLDFEGTGSGDQVGLTNLVTQVSAAIHRVNAGFQVTMDTYASAAGDSSGFYNIRALASSVDAFFVMAYQLNLQASSSSSSPLTSTMFSEKAAIDQYAAAVPPAKVILGMPYFGIDWPTSDGTLTAHATGPTATVTYEQVEASGHPIYWDATTQTGWTSYQVGAQWYEAFFEVPSSLYDAAQLASSSGLGGMGIWALGMDGNDPTMTSALAGLSPAVKDLPVGPTTTSASPTTSTSSTSTTTSSTTSPSTTTSSSPTSSRTSTPSTTSTSTTTSSTSTSSTSTLPQRRKPPTTTSTSSTSTTSTASTTPAETTSTSTSSTALEP